MFDVLFKNQNCSSIGIIPVRRPNIPAPEEKIEEVTVPGRDGVLTISEGFYNNIVIPIEFNFLVAPDKWGETYRKAKKWLTGSGNLKMSDDDSGFYKVVFCKITSTERTSKRVGNFTAEFTCDPYFYFDDGTNEIIASGSIYNPGMICYPLYRITGEGNCVLTVNGNNFTANIGQEIIIDTDLQISYKSDGQMVNPDVSGDYTDLWLNEGDNSITASSGFVINITPRWRTL